MTREQDGKQWILVHHRGQQYRVECQGRTVGRFTIAARDRIVGEIEDLWQGPLQQLAVEAEIDEAAGVFPHPHPHQHQSEGLQSMQTLTPASRSTAALLNQAWPEGETFASAAGLGLMSPTSPTAGLWSQPPSATCDPLAGYSPCPTPTLPTAETVSMPPPPPQPEAEISQKQVAPYFTISGCLGLASPRHPAAEGGMLIYVQRHHGSRQQQYLGEGQLSGKKSKWGRKEYFYEARLPVHPHDELMVMGTLLAMLTQLQS